MKQIFLTLFISLAFLTFGKAQVHSDITKYRSYKEYVEAQIQKFKSQIIEERATTIKKNDDRTEKKKKKRAIEVAKGKHEKLKELSYEDN